MTARGVLLVLVAVLALVACRGPLKAGPDNPLTAGGISPDRKDKDVALVGLRPGFDLKRYRAVVVDALPVTDSAIKDAEDRELASELSAYFRSELARHLRTSGLFATVDLAEHAQSPGEKPLRLGGAITRLGEGSQPLRMFFGRFGAGRARAQADLRFTDAATGEVVLVTSDRRIVQRAFLGGESKKILQDAFEVMARDLARFLDRLSKGQAPSRD